MSRTVAALTLTLVGLCSAGCGILGTKSYRVPSAGMEPTLPVGSHVSADTGQRRPKVGDIVVFHPPTSATSPEGECPPGRGPDAHGRPCATIGVEDRSLTFIKRVVARGGDTIALRGGRVVLSGRVQREPFIRLCDSTGECDFPRPVRVPADAYYLLGDNRGSSDDSRFWGAVPQSWIIGTIER